MDPICNPALEVSYDRENVTYKELMALLMGAAAAQGIFAAVMHGPTKSAALPTSVLYPLFWLEDEAQFTTANNQRTVTFGMIILTQTQQERKDEPTTLDNEISQLSRMGQACDAVVSWLLKYHPYLFNNRRPEYNILSIHRDYADRCVGWRMELTIYLQPNLNCCLPADAIPTY